VVASTNSIGGHGGGLRFYAGLAASSPVSEPVDEKRKIPQWRPVAFLFKIHATSVYAMCQLVCCCIRLLFEKPERPDEVRFVFAGFFRWSKL
jgi:hypothetical protein